MKKPILLSALLGWATAPLPAIIVNLVKPGGSFGGDLWLQILVYIIYCGVIAFPSCLVAGALVNKYLPSSSPWWKPRYAALCGGLAGIVVMHLILTLMSGDFDFSVGRWVGSIIAAVPGAVCGFSLARFKRKRMNLTADR